MLHDVEDAARGAGPRVGGAEHETADACMDHRARAHRAGLERHVKRRVEQAVGPERLSGRAQRDHLGVRAGIVRANRLVPALGDDRPVVHDDGAHRHLPCLLRLPCQIERTPHV